MYLKEEEAEEAHEPRSISFSPEAEA